jgi:hypothetical protein
VDKTLTKPFVIGGSALAKSAAGSCASAQALARFGYRLAPWGVVAGTVLGALAGDPGSGIGAGQGLKRAD